MSIEVRFFAKENAYFLQIQEKEYLRIEKKMKRIRRELNHIRCQGSEKHSELSRQMETLRNEKEHYRYYVKMNAAEIPDKIKVRPIFHMPTNILALSGDDYDKLLREIKEEDESAFAGSGLSGNRT